MAIIDFRSADWESILRDLMEQVEVRGDRAWRDQYASGAGQTILELLSALGAFTSHHAHSALREAFPDSARLRESLVGLSNARGYSVSRKSAPKLKLTVRVLPGEIREFTRFDSLGVAAGRPVCLLRNENLAEGENVLYCALGQWRTRTVTPGVQGDFARLLITDPDVENFFSYRADDGSVFPLVEVEVTRDALRDSLTGRSVHHSVVPLTPVDRFEDFTESACIVRSHPHGVVVAFGDGVRGYKLKPGDLVRVTYLASDGLLPVERFSQADLRGAFAYGDVVRAEYLYPGSDEEPLDAIRATAPLYSAAGNRMVTEDDHRGILMAYPGVVSANCRKSDTDEGCDGCAVEASVLFADKHTLDQQTTRVDRTGVLTLGPSNVYYQNSALHPSALRVGRDGFASGLMTGVRVWVELDTPRYPDDAPLGLQSHAFYYVIRIPDSDYIRLATSYERAVRGLYVHLYPPPSGDPLDGRMHLSVYLDTLRMELTDDAVSLETDATLANSLEVGTALATAMGEVDRFYVTADPGANLPTGLGAPRAYWAVPLRDRDRIFLANTRTQALSGDFISLEAPSSGDPSGTVRFNWIWAEQETGLFNRVVYQTPTDPGYLDLSGLPQAAFFTLQSGGSVPAGTRVRVRLSEGAHFTPEIVNGGEYYVRVEGTRVYFAASRAQAQDRLTCLALTRPVAPLASGGACVFEIYRDIPGGDENGRLSLELTPERVRYGTTRTWINSLDFGADPVRREGTDTQVWPGMRVRVRTEDDDTVLPDGLEAGSFYYAVPVPVEGRVRIRLARAYDDAVSGAAPSQSVPLRPPREGTLQGGLLLDLFADQGSLPLTADTLTYQTVTSYMSSIGAGAGFLTGRKGPNGVSGVPSGAKVVLEPREGVTLPLPLLPGEPYYLVRVEGTTNVRFAATRADALRGIHLHLYPPPGGAPTGPVDVTVYGTPEEDAFRAYLDRYRVLGERIVFVDPSPVYLKPSMTVVTDGRVSSAQVEDAILELLASRLLRLSGTFYIGDVVREISGLAGVRRVYLRKPLSDRILEWNEYLDVEGYIPYGEGRLTSLRNALLGPDGIRVTPNVDRVMEPEFCTFPDDGYVKGSG